MSSTANHSDLEATKEDSQEIRACKVPSRTESDSANLEHRATKHVHLLSGDAAPFIPSFLRNSNVHSETNWVEALPQLSAREGQSSNQSLAVGSEWTVEGSEEIKPSFANVNNEEHERTDAHKSNTVIPCVDKRNSCCDFGNNNNNNKNAVVSATNHKEHDPKSIDSIAVTVTSYGNDDDDVVDAHGGINSYTNASTFLTEHNPYYAILHGMSGDQVQYLISMLPYEVQQAYDENVRILYNSSKKIEEEYKFQQEQQQQQQHYNHQFNISHTRNATELEQNVHGTTLPLANSIQDKTESITLSAAYKTFQELTQEQLEQINNFFSQVEITQSMTANTLPTSASTKNTDPRRRQSRRYRQSAKNNSVNDNNNSNFSNKTYDNVMANDNNYINSSMIANCLDVHIDDGNVIEDEMNSDEEEWLLEQMIGDDVDNRKEASKSAHNLTN